jgi:hypothetical protein
MGEPVFQEYNLRRLSKVTAQIAQTRADQLNCCLEFVRFDVQVFSPMLHFGVIHGVDYHSGTGSGVA